MGTMSGRYIYNCILPGLYSEQEASISSLWQGSWIQFYFHLRVYSNVCWDITLERVLHINFLSKHKACSEWKIIDSDISLESDFTLLMSLFIGKSFWEWYLTGERFCTLNVPESCSEWTAVYVCNIIIFSVLISFTWANDSNTSEIG